MQFLAYLAVLLVTVSSLVLCVDVVTRPSPPSKPASATEQKLAAAHGVDVPAANGENPIRKIPIVSRANPGDPSGVLSPVYPAAPGKDLPVKDTPVKEAAPAAPQPTAARETTGKASASTGDQAAAASGSATAPMPTAAPSPQASPQATTNVSLPSSSRSQPQNASVANSCNVDACAAAYRSFRASDCTYQPFSGPRAVCENPSGANSQAAAAPPPQRRAAEQPAQRAHASAQAGEGRYQDNLRDAAETVRRLPRSSATYDSGDDEGPDTAGPPNVSRYGLRRNWITESDE